MKGKSYYRGPNKDAAGAWRAPGSQRLSCVLFVIIVAAVIVITVGFENWSPGLDAKIPAAAPEG